MTQSETQILASATTHLGVAFGIFAEFVRLSNDDPKYAKSNEAAVQWMHSVVENILRTSSQIDAAMKESTGEHARDCHCETCNAHGYGAGV